MAVHYRHSITLQSNVTMRRRIRLNEVLIRQCTGRRVVREILVSLPRGSVLRQNSQS